MTLLLRLLLKEDGKVLRNIFRISLLLKAVIYITFYNCSNQNDIKHYHILFYIILITILLQTIFF